MIEDMKKEQSQSALDIQVPSLDDGLTADENLRFHATVYGLPASISRERRDEMLKMVDLYDR